MLSVHRVGSRTILLFRGDVRSLRQWLTAAAHLKSAAWAQIGPN